MKKHGYYSRYLITVGFEGVIIIRRYYCGACGKTVSLLPSFCHPKRTYGTQVIIGLLKEFYKKRGAVCLAVLNFFIETNIECSRQLLLQYRQRLEKNLNSLIMAITEIKGLRAPPVAEKKDIKEKARQMLSHIQSPLEESLKIFERTRTTYLTPYPI